MSTSESISQEQIVDIMREERFVMLSTATAEGKIVSHPMTPQEVTGDADVWFLLGLQGDQADAIRVNPLVNLAFAETGSWLSVSGAAEFFDDRGKIAELWDGQLDSYFTGPDDPTLGLLKVVSESAQYWGVPGGGVVSAVKMAAAKITGAEPPGQSGTVTL